MVTMSYHLLLGGVSCCDFPDQGLADYPYYRPDVRPLATPCGEAGELIVRLALVVKARSGGGWWW